MSQDGLPGITTANAEPPARKFPPGERGHHVGRWPERGPFTVYVRDRAAKDPTAPSKGEKFYLCGRIGGRKEPDEGFTAYLARTYGEGWFKVTSEDQPRGALFRITRTLAERADRLRAELADDDDDDDDDQADARPNPDPTAQLLAQAEQFEKLRRALGATDPAPSPLAALASSPQAMAAVLQMLTRAPTPPPAPAPAPDPWRMVAAELAARGLTPEQALAVIRGPAPSSPELDEADDGAELDEAGPLG